MKTCTVRSAVRVGAGRGPAGRQRSRPVFSRLALARLLLGALPCAALPSLHAQHRFTRLHSFGNPTLAADPPWSLIEGSDGKLYGALYGAEERGGSLGKGWLFKLSKDGSSYALLHHFLPFEWANGDGCWPLGRLIEGSDGALYGTTYIGGSSNRGTVFKLNKEGTDYLVLRSLAGGPGEGAGPEAGLAEGADGAHYGTTPYGGSNDLGTVFKLNKDGSGYATLHHFQGGSMDGEQPRGAIVAGTDGALYSATEDGGVRDWGTVFKLNRDGTGFTLLHVFDIVPDHCANPRTALVEGTDGALYGATLYGGTANAGTVFKLNKDGGGYCVVASSPAHLYFASWPSGWLIEARDGALYGASPYGGEADSGTLFRLEVAPILYNPIWSGNVFSFQLNARANVVYQPQFRTSLADSNWTALPSITGQRGVVTVTDTNLNSAPRFYRVVTP